jgi:choline kinase
MKVVNLMAGSCARLFPLTADCHKVLLEIGGKRLVEHQLMAFNAVGIKEAIFVIGHKADLTKSKIGDYYDDVKIKYVFNPYYLTRNIDYSLYLAKDEVFGEDFIYLEADMFFHPKILKMLVNSYFENCLVVDPNPQSDMVDTLVLGKNGKVTGLMFENHGDLRTELKENKEVVGEFLSLMKFNAEASKFLFEELKKCDFEGPITLDRVFERCFQVKSMNYIEVKGCPWVEIDNCNDLKKARKLYAESFWTFNSNCR